MRWFAAGVLIGLVFSGTAQAAPLAKLASFRPYRTEPLTMRQAERAAMRFMRVSAVEEFATDPRVYACERRTRYVVDCDGDMLAETCKRPPTADLFSPCPPETLRTDTYVNLMRVRSRLGFTFVRLRQGPEL